MSSNYYVPEQSKFPLLMSASMFTMLFGFGFVVNGLTAENVSGIAIAVALTGFFGICAVTFSWLRTVIIENIEGKTSAQLQRSFYMGMAWFIFSEVCFFAAFFGALF